MTNQLLDLYTFAILLYTLFKLISTARKTKGGLVGEALVFFSLGFAIVFLLTVQSILETSMGVRVEDIFGPTATTVINRSAQAVAFLTFAIGASRLEKIGK